MSPSSSPFRVFRCHSLFDFPKDTVANLAAAYLSCKSSQPDPACSVFFLQMAQECHPVAIRSHPKAHCAQLQAAPPSSTHCSAQLPHLHFIALSYSNTKAWLRNPKALLLDRYQMTGFPIPSGCLPPNAPQPPEAQPIFERFYMCCCH